jgi:hypothetical protein
MAPFLAWVAFWSSLMGLHAPPVEAAHLRFPLIAQVQQVQYPDPALTAFGGPKILVDLGRLSHANPREIALHEMCHIRMATAQHGRDHKECMRAYRSRAEGH